MRRTLFITGASGFVGGAIVRTLKDRFELRALSRSDSSDATIRALGATPVRGELGSIPADAIAGSEAVIQRDGNRLIIEPVESTSLLDLLATWEPLDVEFPEVTDNKPDPVEL